MSQPPASRGGTKPAAAPAHLTSKRSPAATAEMPHNVNPTHDTTMVPSAEQALSTRPPPAKESDLEIIPAENDVMCDAFAYLIKKEWGVIWEDLVRAFYDFENSCGFL
ncbi:hypothetical protein DXG01_004388, partial [Tephrocybe rancida]